MFCNARTRIDSFFSYDGEGYESFPPGHLDKTWEAKISFTRSSLPATLFKLHTRMTEPKGVTNYKLITLSPRVCIRCYNDTPCFS